MKDYSLVLASSSRYRQALLARLRVPFTSWVPDLDETALPGETPGHTAVRLAVAKALAGAVAHPDAIIIGSDQVADLEGEALGKPGTIEVARQQLRRMRGRDVVFHTAIAVCAPQHKDPLKDVVRTDVRFRPLEDAEIERYLAAEPALDCAGSAKVEALGISLAAAIRSDDPTALIGLPLIALSGLLRELGVAIP